MVQPADHLQPVAHKLVRGLCEPGQEACLESRGVTAFEERVDVTLVELLVDDEANCRSRCGGPEGYQPVDQPPKPSRGNC